jgi:two-component system chemotaxis response regulator CheB
MNHFRAVVMGASAGGLDALSSLLATLPETYSYPVIIVQHVHHEQGGGLVEYFSRKCALSLHEAEDKELVRPGCVYFAPPNYHLLVEPDRTFALSVDEKVHHSRPSIDVLFESAAHVWGRDLAGIVLTGANADGACGLQLIKQYGGLTVIQDPATSEYPLMPQTALDAGGVDYILSLEQIGELLVGKGTHE